MTTSTIRGVAGWLVLLAACEVVVNADGFNYAEPVTKQTVDQTRPDASIEAAGSMDATGGNSDSTNEGQGGVLQVSDGADNSQTSQGGAGGSSGGGAISEGTRNAGMREPDGGTDEPDASVPTQTTETEAAAYICVRLDEVANCPAPAEPCPESIVRDWDFLKTTYPNCASIIDAYFFCMAKEPVTSYDCNNNTPEIASGQTRACADEEAAYLAVVYATGPCIQ